jgi:outer membrane protein assembly factor BamE (lipoprotein component of BamABCDE complex)
MRVLHHIRNNPVTIACVVLLALNAWVALQLFDGGARPREPRVAYVPQNSQVINGQAIPVLTTPTFTADVVGSEVDKTQPQNQGYSNSVVSAAALPKLKAGMTRAEVEGLLGTPPADQIHAVTVNENRITYRTTYEMSESDLPMTIRPIQSRARVPARPNDPLSFVALEFDASQPGHPLLGVLYPDPLF